MVYKTEAPWYCAALGGKALKLQPKGGNAAGKGQRGLGGRSPVVLVRLCREELIQQFLVGQWGLAFLAPRTQICLHGTFSTGQFGPLLMVFLVFLGLVFIPAKFKSY